ncbi:hypothetical protein K503DRAFT_598358 [Rhizopogon vinicolor AM-OR11-026]|uniref:Uncharacterized protein n=1 Tax=Rhizopogon vinicolor AM-OR11-026 TaxID=1314800 RepID=A0A1B7MJ00_9AGAM|nr:hypothetical protein K503DRAFT_598358 [Rhizopogon vinicolor AM-OR11-026]
MSCLPIGLLALTIYYLAYSQTLSMNITKGSQTACLPGPPPTTPSCSSAVDRGAHNVTTIARRMCLLICLACKKPRTSSASRSCASMRLAKSFDKIGELDFVTHGLEQLGHFKSDHTVTLTRPIMEHGSVNGVLLSLDYYVTS